MKIISWNVNGLRAVHRKELFLPFVKKHAPDVLFLQETKCEPSQLPDEVMHVPGYEAFFSASSTRKGYSGVAVYTKAKPDKVEFGMKEDGMHHEEGRLLAIFLGKLALLNIYFPNGGGGPARLEYKLKFYDEFLAHIEKLRKRGFSIIWGGDVNTAHEAIDLARPKENEKNTGFLPEERAWLDEVVGIGYRDTFRHFYPDKKDTYTYWDMKTAARDRNVGWRIDYLFASGDLLSRLQSARILSTVYGSDHCPIELEIK